MTPSSTSPLTIQLSSVSFSRAPRPTKAWPPHAPTMTCTSASPTATRLDADEAFQGAGEWLDAYANSVYRSIKNHRDGQALAARLDATAAIGFLLELLFTLDRRPAPTTSTWNGSSPDSSAGLGHGHAPRLPGPHLRYGRRSQPAPPLRPNRDSGPERRTRRGAGRMGRGPAPDAPVGKASAELPAVAGAANPLPTCAR